MRKVLPITKDQKAFIEAIEENLQVKYEGGNNRSKAGNFLDIYAPKNREYCISNNIDIPITFKQSVFITNIETVLEIEFTGTTLEEASDFIQENKRKFYAVCKSLERMAKIKKGLEMRQSQGDT